MPTLLELFDLISRRKKANDRVIADDLRKLIIEIGDAEMGREPKRPFDENRQEVAAALLEAFDLSEADFRENVDEYKRRVRQARLADRVEVFQKQAALAWEAHATADLREGQRRRQEMEKLNGLEEAAQRAQKTAEEAISAQSDLIASAERTVEEKALAARVNELNHEAVSLRKKLDPNGQNPKYGLAVMCDQFPAVAEREALSELQELHKAAGSALPERIDRINSTLTTARRNKAEAERRLKEVDANIAAANKDLARFAADKIRPESFVIVRHKMSADEHRKQHAREMGVAVVAPLQ